MTTTTQAQSLDITVTISDGDLLADGTPTTAAVDRLAQQIADAIAAEYPGARVSVPVQRRTSGGGSVHVHEEPTSDAAGCPTFVHDDYAIREDVHEIEERTWQAWSESLTDADVES